MTDDKPKCPKCQSNHLRDLFANTPHDICNMFECGTVYIPGKKEVFRVGKCCAKIEKLRAEVESLTKENKDLLAASILKNTDIKCLQDERDELRKITSQMPQSEIKKYMDDYNLMVDDAI